MLDLFKADRDEGATPYQEQGDPTMYTPEALAKRRELASTPGVVRVVEKVRGVSSRTFVP